MRDPYTYDCESCDTHGIDAWGDTCLKCGGYGEVCRECEQAPEYCDCPEDEEVV